MISAPMAGAAGGALARAVSSAGALGLVAVGHGAGEAYIERELAVFTEPGSGSPATAPPAPPWGVGLMAWSLELEAQRTLHRVLEHRPPVIALAAGDPTTGARLAAATGALVAVQVGTEAEVDAASANPDIDLVVVRGSEGGGHGLNAVATLPLLQYAAQRCLAKPVAAAGGIATSAGLAAILAAGAQAAWIGTRFIPCAESLAAPALRDAVARAGLDDTVYTSFFDLVLGLPWPAEYGGRALRNAAVTPWEGRESELVEALNAQTPEAQALRAAVTAARGAGDATAAPVYAGQSAGLVPSTAPGTPAAEVIAELDGFRCLLRAASARWF
ncbi:MAG: nitronate monooxygenase [Arthrobacter sp.]|nr:nitronate monooxygenase [Arthrobacter sp.]